MWNRVRSLRRDRRWTQAELGEALGVSRQTIIAIENGKYDPSLRLAFAIAAVFELRVVRGSSIPTATMRRRADQRADRPSGPSS